MNPALKTLLYLSLCGTVLACVLAIVQRLVGRRLPSRFYYFAWLVVLARFALPIPGLMPTQPGAAEPQKITAPTPQRMVHLPSERDSRSDAPMTVEPDLAEGEPVTVEAAAAAMTEPTAPPETATVQTAAKPCASFTMPDWGWTAIWALGAAGCALWYVLGYRRFTHALRKTLLLPRAEDERIYRAIEVRRRPTLARSRAVATPMLFGVFRPAIVLPDEDYDSETLRLILLHELTHHRRGDIAVKWMAALVYSLHWFNPFLLLIRRRVDECCELSCDERLLRGMDKSQRQAYGHALLAMAGSAPLSAAVVSTSFATEKRTLKERLEQIMKYKTRKGLVLIWALAAAMLLCACTVAIGPGGEGAAKTFEIELSDVSAQASGELGASSEEASFDIPSMEPPQETVEVTKPVGGQIVTVSTVDELLAAIAPGNVVHLEPGAYDLDQAADYGLARIGGYYTWEEVLDGYELQIHDLSGLTLLCESGEAEIRTTPLYADVLAFYGCDSLRMEGLTIGHTEGAGLCMGSVVSFTNGSDVDIARCGLYGCGTIGVEATGCRGIEVRESDIYECSHSAATFANCYDVAMVDCALYDCGEPEWMSSSLVELMSCYEVEIVNCEVYDNSAAQMIAANYSKRVMMLGCGVRGNEFSRGLFGMTRAELIVDGCFFEDVGDGELIAAAGAYGDVSGTASGTIRNIDGEDLTSADLRAMKRSDAFYNGVSVPPETVALDIETGEDGRRYVTVSNVDEFLAAIAPNTTIRMAAGEYDLSESEYYGVPISGYYGWESGYDGPQLVISGVDGLTIEGAGADVTELLAVPRSAEIIHFFRCEDLTVSGLTAGHVEMDTGCGAGVLGFEDCARVEISECGLFGCGTEGVTARRCCDLTVRGTEIYDCSAKAASIYECENVVFENCDIHDCASNEIFVLGSVNVTLDGEALRSLSSEIY